MSRDAERDRGSFRDPSGQVWHHEGRIFRTIKTPALAAYEALKNSDLLNGKFQHGCLVKTWEVSDKKIWDAINDTFETLLEHEKINTLSYPYEWCFSQLKAAALFQLELMTRALDKGMILSDATAYNIQFRGTRPCFIDVLSFRPYRDGEIWEGYQQFCEQFLNPLLFQCETGIHYNAWYRGNMEGIKATDLVKVLPFWKKFKPKIAAHVVLPASLQARANAGSIKKMAEKGQRRALPLLQLKGIVASLTGWIEKMEIDTSKPSVWSEYEQDNTYSDNETRAKAAFLTEIVQQHKPNLIWDIGCNSGQFAETCLQAGATEAVGLDFDIETVALAVERARSKDLNFLAFYQDLANPSPGQGWAGRERSSLHARCHADVVIALALIHHLVIGRNIPMMAFTEWLVSFAPKGVVEFVPKNDPMVQALLANREDIFPDYTAEQFETALEQFATIKKSDVITETGRTLYFYEGL